MVDKIICDKCKKPIKKEELVVAYRGFPFPAKVLFVQGLGSLGLDKLHSKCYTSPSFLAVGAIKSDFFKSFVLFHNNRLTFHNCYT